MATFDIPDAPHPLTVTVCRDNRPHDFSLPVTTSDPAEMEMLRKHPGVVEVMGGSRPAAPEPESPRLGFGRNQATSPQEVETDDRDE
jgi:hypothetical protein